MGIYGVWKKSPKQEASRMEGVIQKKRKERYGGVSHFHSDDGKKKKMCIA